MIQYMKELGMELREIKEVFDKCDLDLIEDILHRKKEQSIQQLTDLKLKYVPSTALYQALSATANLHRQEQSHLNTYQKDVFILLMLLPIFMTMT